MMNVLLVSNNNALVEQITQLLNTEELNIDVSEEWTDSLEEYVYVFIDERVIDDQEPIRIPPHVYAVGLMDDPSFEVTRRWMKAGVKDLLIVSKELDRLKEIVQYTRDHVRFGGQHAAAIDLSNKGNVHAFYSSKGGSGKTLLSTMVAQCLKVEHNSKVIMIDLNAQFGGLEVILGLNHSRSYVDLLPVLNELSIHHIQNITATEERTGLDVLLGPSNPETAEQVDDELIARMIRICQEHYDHVVIDMPSDLNSLSFTALNESKNIYYVLTPDSLGLRSLKHAITVFERFQIGKRQHLSLILNRVHQKNELTESDITKLIEIPVTGTLRADYFGIQPMLNMGIPFYLKKGQKAKTKLTKDVQRFISKTMITN
ncbi:AAA family ATPase [Geomicrobium sp. JCM 19039]|uniref:AAA family ATPase n=1 Tax=Geomicrobium sp. JCM 19039 TaxID=1460636 RepID=UPI00045F2BDB|nr:AAA family ATPase [Geomicrobium sp. JCM 19039]GAK13690.1 type II/IV secretion system ATPase TadZ/CpaE, associated with Flp pilus assembly [Geomicrobium sp. JCM 19039]